jgi:predicted amidohydrolase
MVVDFDGRILAQADPGPGEKIVVGPIDLASLRAERSRRRGHCFLDHLRTEANRGKFSTFSSPRTAGNPLEDR